MVVPLGSALGLHKTLRSVISFGLNDAGQVTFLAHHDEEGRDAGIYTTTVDGGATPRLVAATGEAVPGVSQYFITWFGPPQIDGAGRVLFAALGAHVDEQSGAMTTGSFLLTAQDGRLALLAAEGEQISGVGTLIASNTTGDEPVSPAAFFDLQVNERGDALFLSAYLDAASNAFVPAGLFLLSDGSLRLAAAIGQKAPLPMMPTYNSLSSPRLSDGGAIVFLAGTVGSGRKPRSALFRIYGSQTTPLALVGDAAPTVDGGFYRALQAPTLNAAGDVAFLALLDGVQEVRRSGALYVSNGMDARLALGAGDDGAAAGTIVRMDDLSPAAPIAFLDDGSLLIAAREAGVSGSAGLFLVEPD